MRKIRKISVILLIILFVSLYFVNNITFASDVLQSFSGATNAEGSAQITKLLSTVLNIVRIAGTGIATIMLLVIGIKYAMASAGERAEIKKYAVTYIIGAIVLFGASGILTIIKDVIVEGVKSE